MKLALLTGLAMTGIAFAVFSAFPTRDTYLAAPGVILAWAVNGGVHGSGLGRGFAFWFWVVAFGTNFFLYSFCAWVAMRSFLTPKAKS